MTGNCEPLGKLRIIPFLKTPTREEIEAEQAFNRQLMERATDGGLQHQGKVARFPQKINNELSKPETKPEQPAKRKYNKIKKAEQPLTLAEKARRIFEDMLSSDKKWGLDYYTFDILQDCLTSNQRKALKFILKDTVKKRSGITVIKQEEFFTGKKRGNEIYITPVDIPKRSLELAIGFMKKQEIIFTKDFNDKKGVLYILNTDMGKKIYELVYKGKMTKEDCEQLNIVIEREQKTFNTLDLKEDILPQRGEIISSQRRKYFATVANNFRHSEKDFSPLSGVQTPASSTSSQPLPNDPPKGFPKGILLDPLKAEKNPGGIFSDDEKYRVLKGKTGLWKMTINTLDNLVKKHSLDHVFYCGEYLEGLEAKGKKILKFEPYLKKVLKNFNLQDYLKGRPGYEKEIEKLAEQQENDNIKLSLLQCFDPGTTKIRNWNRQLGIFIEYLFTAHFLESNEKFVLDLIGKMKGILTPEELENILLEGAGLENVSKFMVYYREKTMG